MSVRYVCDRPFEVVSADNPDPDHVAEYELREPPNEQLVGEFCASHIAAAVIDALKNGEVTSVRVQLIGTERTRGVRR